MKEISLITYIKKNIEDEYAMNVFYYSVKKSFVERDFSLYGFSYFYIDGRFLGEPIKVISNANYRTPLHVLACLLSIRLLMINHKYIGLCDGDSLIVVSKPRQTFQWVSIMSLILKYWDDDEVKMLYRMIENYYYDEEFTDEAKTDFKKTVVVPEYRNEKEYYKKIAQRTNGVSDRVIGNNAFVEASIDNYIVSKDIVYVGNTAFAYCDKLNTLVFEGKVLFGTFSIIECNNLKQIIVPTDLLAYYKGSLPYYKSIITDKENDSIVEDKERGDKALLADTRYNSFNKEASKIERKPIETNLLDTIFDKKTTSYKYFWFMSIISLAKERDCLVIPYKDILIRMTAMAWPIVFDHEIVLSKSDMLPRFLEEITKKTKLIRHASSQVVETYLIQHYNSQGIDKILAPLLKNVPYRFLSPWIQFTTNEDVVEKSKSNNYACPYALHDKEIVLDEDWWEYIINHYSQICDFAKDSFVNYTKVNNSNLKLMKFMLEGWSMIKR